MLLMVLSTPHLLAAGAQVSACVGQEALVYIPCWLETWRVWPRAISSSPLPPLICTTQAPGDKATTKGFELGVTDTALDKE